MDRPAHYIGADPKTRLMEDPTKKNREESEEKVQGRRSSLKAVGDRPVFWRLEDPAQTSP